MNNYENTYFGKGCKKTEYYEDDGTIYEERYYKYGLLHREDNGPSVIGYFKNGETIRYERYYMKGLSHRTNGPAIVEYDVDGNITRAKYYLKGKEYNEIEYFIKLGTLAK